MTMNLIDQLVEITEKYVDSPQVFHQAMAYHILSTTLGRFYRLVDVKISRPNTWFIISCIPGRGRRSTIINLSNAAVMEALKQFYIGTEKLDDGNAYERAWRSTIAVSYTHLTLPTN